MRTFEEICAIEPRLKDLETDVKTMVIPREYPYHWGKVVKAQFVRLVGMMSKKPELDNCGDYDTVYYHLYEIYCTRPYKEGDDGYWEAEKIRQEWKRAEAKARAEEEREATKLYFIQCSLTGYIKIGISKNPVWRLHNLQCGSPGELKLLKVVRDGSPFETEKKLHKELKKHRAAGEWFKPTDEVLECARRFGVSFPNEVTATPF